MPVQCRPNACVVQTDSGSAELGCVAQISRVCRADRVEGCARVRRVDVICVVQSSCAYNMQCEGSLSAYLPAYRVAQGYSQCCLHLQDE